ncbi:MAG: hypothetical protein ACK4MS_08465 [Paracoccaceae bacterium]
MTDRFKYHARGVAASAEASFVITPSDTVNLPEAIRQITLGSGGTLRWTGRDGMINVTGVLPAGSYPIAALRIHTTGTTATGLTGWV